MSQIPDHQYAKCERCQSRERVEWLHEFDGYLLCDDCFDSAFDAEDRRA